MFRDYALTGFDEMFAGPARVRPHYHPLFDRLSTLPPQELERRGRLADQMMRQQGITFTVYGRGNTERIMPFCSTPSCATPTWATCSATGSTASSAACRKRARP